MHTELYWIPGPWLGRLAIMPRPRGGDWLEDEIRSWRMPASMSSFLCSLVKSKGN